MKFKRNSKGKKGADGKFDAKDRSHHRAFGDSHPVNDVDPNLKVHVVKEEEDEPRYQKRRHQKSESIEDPIEAVEEFVSPFQNLLTDLNKESSLNKSIVGLKRKLEALRNDKKNESKRRKEKRNKKIEEDDEDDGDDSDITDDDEEATESEDEEIQIEDIGDNTYAQEVLCKDNSESEEKVALDQFTQHFEQNVDIKLIEKLKNNLKDRSVLESMEKTFKLPALGQIKYSPLLEETKLNLDNIKDPSKLHIKQRMLDRMNEAIKTILDKDDIHLENTNEDQEIKQLTETKENEKNPEQINVYNLEKEQLEILNLISNYSDFYHPNVDVKLDSEIKFTYAIHALNHVLKTRSRIIAHNDKIKQSRNSNTDIEHRDQGLTRPKVLIIVPFRKCALELIQTFISLTMRKSEEFVSNKKRFYDSFGPLGTRHDEVELDEDGNEIKKERPDDHNLLFSGNVEDHFKIGMSISKKSIKLYTEFYSSDIIIASPLGLKSVIGGDGDGKADFDFLSSIEVLIVDNADVLMMQNLEHVLTAFEHLHLQPKKSHDVDFSRVRNWLLDGHSQFYRQTILFSRIPAAPINRIFNRYCRNYAGKCQVDLMKTEKFQTGSICRIGFNLAQMFHRIECDSPLDLPDARFNFFIEKILPQFRDEQMAHTLIFIPSYFDFVKIRNYFKKHDLSSMHCSEYIDKKGIDRARYLFYHGRVHFMLLTERFHFYNRYRIRGITNIIFYELPHYAEYYSNFCNYLPDPKRANATGMEQFTTTVLYSKFDAQKLCAVVGHQRASHMVNSTKNVHMFMVEDN